MILGILRFLAMGITFIINAPFFVVFSLLLTSDEQVTLGLAFRDLVKAIGGRP